MKRSALCLVDTETQADAIVSKLRSAGFSDNDISVLFPDKGSTRDFAHKKETKMPEGATVGASTGGVVGGAIGFFAWNGALCPPRLGSLYCCWTYYGGAQRRGHWCRSRRSDRSLGRIGHP